MKLTTDLVLYQLKHFGEQPAARIAQACSVSAVSVRNHLGAMLPMGLVAYMEVKAGRGRPRRVWSLTPHGHARFPDRHADLATELIEQTARTLGRRALDHLITARHGAQQDRQDLLLADSPGLRSRLSRLQEMREQDGFMPHVTKVGRHDWLFVQDHCPIRAAAAACPQLCASELELLRRAVGDQADVARVEHVLAGGRRCAYQVTGRNTTARCGT
jgi:predicted ArsR family transcriptional regulator